MGKIVSLIDRLEQWHTAYTTTDGIITFQVSSNGRTRIVLGGENTATMSTVDTIAMLSNISQEVEKLMQDKE